MIPFALVPSPGSAGCRSTYWDVGMHCRCAYSIERADEERRTKPQSAAWGSIPKPVRCRVAVATVEAWEMQHSFLQGIISNLEAGLSFGLPFLTLPVIHVGRRMNRIVNRAHVSPAKVSFACQ